MKDINEIVNTIKLNLINEGISKNEVDTAFGFAQREDLKYISELFETYVSWSSYYQEFELNYLKNVTVPEVIINFYRNFEPKRLPILNGGINLLGLNAIKEENSSAAPGMYLIKYGVITFATTIGGNAICLDLNETSGGEPRVIICDYTFCSHNEDLSGVEIVNVPDAVSQRYDADEPIMLSYELIKECLPEVCKTFSGFLRNIAKKVYNNIEEEYLKY